MLARFFRLDEHGTDVRTEVLAGLITFMTMSYIVFVQPAVLSGRLFGTDTGMDIGAVTTATCLSAALATAIMALYARYPIAQAPGMGENFFFVLTVIPAAAAAGHPRPWSVALGVVFVSGVLFLLSTVLGLRRHLLEALSPSMRNAIAVGIGAFIAFIGLQNANLVIADPGTAVSLNPELLSPDMAVFAVGLLITAVLHARRVPGSILWGILGATGLALALRYGLPWIAGPFPETSTVGSSMLMERFALADRLVSAPPSLAPTFLQFDLRAALSATMVPFVVIFLVMDLFDTLGTIVGVSEQAGLMEEGELPRAERAMVSDAVGTVAGAALGTSTVTSFIESAAGVEQGGRTGLTSLTVAGLFLLAPFFTPVVAMIGSYPPITAPALVVVGAMMFGNAAGIDWADPSESIPAFLVMIGIPVTYSIADGLTLGLVAYPAVKLLSGRGREVSKLLYPLAALLAAYLLFIRSVAG